MGYVSLWFFLFLIVLFPIHFAVKKKYRWIVLLIASVIFYLLCSYKSIIFLLFTTISIYLAAVFIERNKIKEKEDVSKLEDFEQKKLLKKKNKRIRKTF